MHKEPLCTIPGFVLGKQYKQHRTPNLYKLQLHPLLFQESGINLTTSRKKLGFEKHVVTSTMSKRGLLDKIGSALLEAALQAATPYNPPVEQTAYQEPEDDEDDDWAVVNNDLTTTDPADQFIGASYFEEIDREAAQRKADQDKRGLKTILKDHRFPSRKKKVQFDPILGTVADDESKARKVFTKAKAKGKEGLKKFLKPDSFDE